MNQRQDGGERRRLERPPGDRYRVEPPRPPAAPRSRARAIVALIAVTDGGAVGFFALGLLDLGIGLLAIAAFLGWAIGLVLIWWGRDAIVAGRGRTALAVSAGAWSIVLAIAIDWGYGLTQGGVLGPLDYVAQRYGPWGPLSVLVAALVASWRAR